ncbi:MAG: type II toxin-antitoxin system RelE/ParE family toxin [Patescibacteria group bacterium]
MPKNIILEKLFIKHYKQRLSNNKLLILRYEERVDMFLRDRNNPVLKDHQLKGKLKQYRSFSVAGDCRIIYKEEEKDVVFIFIDIGTHNQVYK